MNAQCPECDSLIQVPPSAEVWDNLVCPRCHTELQLISDQPLMLGYADPDNEYGEYEDDDGFYFDDDLDLDDDDDDDEIDPDR
jgi:hypothetical protein